MYTSRILMGVTHPNQGETPMASPQIDDLQLSSLVSEGLSQTEIAKRLGMSRSTVRDRLKKLGLASTPDTTTTESTQGTLDVYTESTQGIPDVYKNMLITMISDLQEVVVWWQERKATLQQASDASRQTERITFHVERRWIEAIRRQADLDGFTYTQIVNQAFRQHFEGK